MVMILTLLLSISSESESVSFIFLLGLVQTPDANVYSEVPLEASGLIPLFHSVIS